MAKNWTASHLKAMSVHQRVDQGSLAEGAHGPLIRGGSEDIGAEDQEQPRDSNAYGAPSRGEG
jgi:hypothetical protein